MVGKVKYAPSKTALTMAELKAKLKEATDSLRKANNALTEAMDALKLARELLKEKEEENRQLKLIILRMTEQKGGDGDADHPRSPLD